MSGDAVGSSRGLMRIWNTFRGALAEEETRSREATAALPAGGVDGRALAVLFGTAILLTVQEYYSKRGFYLSHVMPKGANGSSPDQQMKQLLYWATICVATYLVIPSIIVKAFFKQRLSEYGLTWRGFWGHAWIYAIMFAGMVPIVWWASTQPSFLQTYPFYRASLADPSGYWLWAAAYGAQFFALEFFFRGFMVHGLKRRFGAYGIVIMAIPYCMIHYGKPIPETLGAVIAGVALGWLSLRSGSIMLGVLIHVSVALTMDLMSLWRQAALPF